MVDESDFLLVAEGEEGLECDEKGQHHEKNRFELLLCELLSEQLQVSWRMHVVCALHDHLGVGLSVQIQLKHLLLNLLDLLLREVKFQEKLSALANQPAQLLRVDF